MATRKVVKEDSARSEWENKSLRERHEENVHGGKNSAKPQAAQAVKEEWGAFCWNYTLNYALHSGAVRARETKTWQLKQANA